MTNNLIDGIDPDREYSPQEIAKKGWLLNTINHSSYHYILKLINTGRLRARNVCLTGQKYYKILGQSIIDYRNGIREEHHLSTEQN